MANKLSMLDPINTFPANGDISYDLICGIDKYDHRVF